MGLARRAGGPLLHGIHQSPQHSTSWRSECDLRKAVICGPPARDKQKGGVRAFQARHLVKEGSVGVWYLDKDYSSPGLFMC